MKKIVVGLSGLLTVLTVLLGLSTAQPTLAETSVALNINVGVPILKAAPEVVYVPQSQVYVAPSVEYNLFFFQGYWWAFHGDRWYRAGGYNGPWIIIERRLVPSPLFRVPANFRSVYKSYKHIPYGQLKKHWQLQKGKPGPAKDQIRQNMPNRKLQPERGEGHGRGR